eukprot:scaffold1419_cov410-Prasinococcus_capsulatus_cf.AAC.20
MHCFADVCVGHVQQAARARCARAVGCRGSGMQRNATRGQSGRALRPSASTTPAKAGTSGALRRLIVSRSNEC